MDKKTFGIGVLGITAAVLLAANALAPRPAAAILTTKDRDFSLVTASSQFNNNGTPNTEALFVLDNRTGKIAIYSYDPTTKTVAPRTFGDMGDAVPPGPLTAAPVKPAGPDAGRPNGRYRMTMQLIRHDWTPPQVRAVYDTPLMELVFRAATVHRQYHDAGEVQVCKLISIKTGGCPEDCKYCSQSSRYQTPVDASPLMAHDEVVAVAQRAKDAGLTRVCMGAAWRQVRDNADFDRVLEMVRSVNDLGLEVCCTLGMLTEDQARRLADAGLHAYNHNLDTSRSFYGSVITTRTYDDRLRTIDNVRKADVTVCSGGILGLGETPDDRLSMLQTLATLDPHPDSVPVNILSRVPGTPMADNADVPFWETLKTIAVARILMPKATIRMSAGRVDLTESQQALCFMAGVGSIFSSDERIMLTKAAGCADYDQDKALLSTLGLTMRPPFKDGTDAARRREPAAELAGL